MGYLLKDRVADIAEFADAVRRVGEGGSALDPAVVSRLVGRRRGEDPLDALTPRERGVLELMAEGRSNQAIAEKLVVTPRAVEKHVTSIFMKLNLPVSSEDHRRVLAVVRVLNALGRGSARADPRPAEPKGGRWAAAARDLTSGSLGAGTVSRTPRGWRAPFRAAPPGASLRAWRSLSDRPFSAPTPARPSSRRSWSYYALYELGRGFGDASARRRADEHGLDRRARALARSLRRGRRPGLGSRPLPSLPAFLGALRDAPPRCTGAAMVWLHRRHPERFPAVGTRSFSPRALAGRLRLFPAAPPRLSGLGFMDTVTAHTREPQLGLPGEPLQPLRGRSEHALRLPLIVGAALFAYSSRSSVRVIGALYPPFMLFVIVATGNHFVFDAVAG